MLKNVVPAKKHGHHHLEPKKSQVTPVDSAKLKLAEEELSPNLEEKEHDLNKKSNAVQVEHEKAGFQADFDLISTRKAVEEIFDRHQAEEDESQGNLEDGRVTKFEFSRLKMNEFGLLFFSLLGILLSIIAVSPFF